MKKSQFSFKIRFTSAVLVSLAILSGGIVSIYTASTPATRNISWIVFPLLLIAVSWYIRTIIVTEQLSKQIDDISSHLRQKREETERIIGEIQGRISTNENR